MDNFPKLSLTLEQGQFRSKIMSNEGEIIGQGQGRKLTTASQGRNLSPFTWNNIKLPAVFTKDRYDQVINPMLKDSKKQVKSKKNIETMNTIQVTKLKTIAQKTKKALNVSMQLKNIMPKKKSPIKKLHQQVLVQYEKRKNTSIPKRRNDHSFTQKYEQIIIPKAYETMEIKGYYKPNTEQKTNLKNIEARYRNFKSLYEGEIGRNLGTVQHNRYTLKVGCDGSDKPRGRVKYQGAKNRQKQASMIEQLNGSVIMKSSRNSFSRNTNSLSINQQMEPYICEYFKKMVYRNEPQKLKIFVTSNPKYHPLHMNEYNGTAFDRGSNNLHRTLIWTKLESLNIFREKQTRQYYNHVEGSYVLTSKQRLNEIMNGGKGVQRYFYPVSFSFPREYNEFVQQYDWTLVKMCLRFIVMEVKKFQRGSVSQIVDDGQSTENRQFNICLSDILDDLTHETKNQYQLKLLKFCLFLQSGRKKQKLNQMFQKLKTYRSVDIKLSESMYIDIIDWCIALIKFNQQSLQQNQNTKNNLISKLGMQNVDYRLIQLLKAYDYLFLTYLPSYLYRTLSSSHNTWVIKPFASSKAAGISLIIDSQEFYTTSDYEYKEYRHRSKYHNKIFMKYIENPLLIRHSGIDFFVKKVMKDLKKQVEKMNEPEQVWDRKVREMNEKVDRFLALEEKFCGRKFDIRQWVLIVCDQHVVQNIQGCQRMMGSSVLDGKKSSRSPKGVKTTKIYKYETAYCRFAQKSYSLDTKDLQVHLTNYDIYKKSLLKTDRRSPSIVKNNKSLNTSINEKSEYINSLTEQNTREKNVNDEKIKNRKRLGSMVKEQKESVLMLDELFEYLQFVSELKEKTQLIGHTNKKDHSSSIRSIYETQLDRILSSLFQACQAHIVHHSRTFELFGVDLLLDEDMNLFLLEVNLNPGCSSERDDKLNKEAQVMLQTMFETVMGFEGRSYESDNQEEYKQNVVLDDQLIGSKQFIYENDDEVDDRKQIQMKQKVEIKNQQNQENVQGIRQKQNKWTLVCQNVIC